MGCIILPAQAAAIESGGKCKLLMLASTICSSLLLFSHPLPHPLTTRPLNMDRGLGKKSVLIVGGGFAGLSVAYALKSAYNCVLLDPKT